MIADKNNFCSSPCVFSALIIPISLFCSSLLISQNNTLPHYIWIVCLLGEAKENLENVFLKLTLCVMISHALFMVFWMDITTSYTVVVLADFCYLIFHQYKSNLLYSGLNRTLYEINCVKRAKNQQTYPTCLLNYLYYLLHFLQRLRFFIHSSYGLHSLHLCFEEFQLFQKSYFQLSCNLIDCVNCWVSQVFERSTLCSVEDIWSFNCCFFPKSFLEFWSSTGWKPT